MTMKKRLLIMLMIVMTAIGMMPVTGMAVQAEGESNYALRLVTDGEADNILGAQQSNVWYGTYLQSAVDEEEFSADPVKWRVLKNGDHKLFLMSDLIIDCRQYHETPDFVTWYSANMRHWLNGLKDTNYDYTDDNFKDTAFSEAELDAIAVTTVVTPPNPSYGSPGSVDTEDKIFLLSLQEAVSPEYGFPENPRTTPVRIAEATDYAVSKGIEVHESLTPEYDGKSSWWLRTRGADGYTYPMTTGVDYLGAVSDEGIDHVDAVEIGVRPVFNLDLDSVLFTCAAEGGKFSGPRGADALTAVPVTYTNEWKITIKDSSRNFTVSDGILTENGVSVEYSGAETGDQEFISAVIVDSSGNITYYGRVAAVSAAGSSGEITINTDNKLREGDTLYVFNEQFNGDKMTDYASELQPVNIKEESVVTFDPDNGEDPYTVSVNIGETVSRPAEDPVKPGYTFLGWYEVLDTMSDTPFDFDTLISVDTLLRAKWADEAMPKITKHALLLSGEIGVTFRIAFPDEFDEEKFFIEFTAADGRSRTVRYEDLTVIEGSSDRSCIFNINALELAEEITAELHYGDRIITDTYSAMNYIEYAQNNMTDNAKLTDLVNALHAYGYYMQKSGWTDDKESHTPIPEPQHMLTAGDVQTASEMVSGYDKTENFGDSGITDSGFSLVLNARTVISIYLKPAEGVTITSDGGKTIEVDGETWYQFNTPKIGPKHLGRDYTVTAETNLGEASVSASAMAYVKRVFDSDFTEAQKYAMAAYYYYYAAADQY